ncbi:hypothetical protein [Paracoccus sp. KR1-242]|uniref:hypothetical protein n=1 Tax=Paracoccus sp. KR1-242 TaxID=3410028 RepID=UPI003C0458A3
MSHIGESIARLADLARLKSDLEMRRFAAYRAHVEAARARITTLTEELQALYDSEAAHSLSGARLANALAGDRSRALGRAEVELEQMMPGYQAARGAALREFGRVQALEDLHARETDARRLKVQRKQSDGT